MTADCGCIQEHHDELPNVVVLTPCTTHRIGMVYLDWLHTDGGHEDCCGDLDAIRDAVAQHGEVAVRKAAKELMDRQGWKYVQRLLKETR